MQPKSRYDVLLKIIAAHKPKTIVEVGTWNGLRAIEMLREARKHQNKVRYIGYDLFDDATPETDARELNVKAHASIDEVSKTISSFAKSIKKVDVKLVKGDTRETLHGKDPLAGMKRPIMAFIDGGHSVETIRGDYKALKKADVLIMDDFYTKDDKGLCPDTEKFGCNTVIKENELDGIMAGGDPVTGGGKVALFVYPADKFPGQVQLRVQTKNCVPDKHIIANVAYNSRLIGKFVAPCDPHDDVAVFCSGGPTLMNYIEDIRKWAEAPNAYVLCVKHSHDKLIQAGIIPWGCILLDPRSHVQDFIENPHPKVNYVVATMVHPTTTDRLIQANARVLGYNALVGAGEDTALPPKSYLINGGTTSAVRGISVFHFLGFRKFKLYGYDSCYEKPANLKERTKTGQQKHYEVTSAGRKFWTDAELVAQVQDMEKLMEVAPQLDIEVFGDGLLQHVVRTKQASLVLNRSFHQEFGKRAA